ncbi:solute carrier family 52, riboflavin transporter, member 2 isoform X1 [Chiloscyllium plagiosum]|uniref:solute carrier family 52, riboflavin transporter, member 2 isoform X1 n=2 Tax=Chiloscyllium plagiosum TaxID=36176 RepID=UPI001CB8686E|nr:solute carrier family 52, riboflavin transporter, member 2 isoform X1 [Chiloscyllium plagiosum]
MISGIGTPHHTMPTREFRNTLFTHLLVAMFGMGSWVAVNSLWVELPVITQILPEAWNLPAYLTVLIAFSNVGPLLVTLAHRFSPGLLNERCLIYSIQALGVISSVALALTWDRIVLIGGERHSVAFLTLAFALAFVCCTSNVTFLPFMFRLSSKYIKTFFVGQGFSAFFPCVAALVQGVGQLECRNSSAANGSQSLQPHYLEESFTASTFFWLLVGLMSISLLSFAGLARKSNSKQHTTHDGKESCQLTTESKPTPKIPAPFCTTRNVYLLILLAVSNALTNGVLPSIQTYSCLPYGSTTFHLAVVLGNLANPLACFIAMFVHSRSSIGLGVLAFLGLLCGVYILTLAALSPCPLLLGSSMGVVLVVSAWMLFTGLFSYVKVVIGSILHEAGHLALVWCGASIQIGSLIGALVMFPLVSVYQLFTSGQACVDICGQ